MPTPSNIQALQAIMKGIASPSAVLGAGARRPFASEAVEFVERFGRKLLQEPEVRQFPELVALGYWARRSRIAKLRERFNLAYPLAFRYPRGLAFHVAPSNVDTMFVYSLLLSILAGNSNIVRISSRLGQQTDILLRILVTALEGAPLDLCRSFSVVTYPHDRCINDAFSSAAQMRIVWGGNQTVDEIRRSRLHPTATELVFPDRYSLAVMSAAEWMRSVDRQAVARAFVNDTLWFGQSACASPRALIWLGAPEAVAAATASFWPEVEAAATSANLPWVDSMATTKLLAEQNLAAAASVAILPMRSNRLRVIKVGLNEIRGSQAVADGFLRQTEILHLADLRHLIERDWQTVASFGIGRNEWECFFAAGDVRGIDRVVPFGSALDFDSIWDGIDILAAMTRIVSLCVA